MTVQKHRSNRFTLTAFIAGHGFAVTPVRDKYTKNRPETAVGKRLHRRTAVRLSKGMFLRLDGGTRGRFAARVLQELATRI